jgi:GNAT superfamily N-acetyltransferase
VEPPGPDDHPRLAAAARNCAEGYAFPSRRMGLPELTTDLVIGADLGLPVLAPTNSATLLRPARPEEVDRLLHDVRALFRGPGGGWQLWDPWDCVDLAAAGFGRGETPCMLRPAGGEVPPPPERLRIVEVRDEGTVADMNEVVLLGYGLPERCRESMWTVDVVGDPRYRAWVGYEGDRAVSTASACLAGGLVGVYAVATVPEARGRGYGEALTWCAVTSAHDLDAVLQASDMGLPVYERMGFETIRTYVTWSTDVRGAPTWSTA